jgi:glutamine amidotransferase
MPDQRRATVAIVDYGMGNLFSVRQACEHAGLDAVVTSSPAAIGRSDAVIVPGVGAFGKAMETLVRLGLVDALERHVSDGKLLLGICLGMQLLMDESSEFGRHRGLGFIAGDVVRFPDHTASGSSLKVPQVCWNQVRRVRLLDRAPGGPLDDLGDGEFMYFAHSYYVRPSRPEVIVATTHYGGVEFCSALACGNIHAWQFHAERSGPRGLAMCRKFARAVEESRQTGIRA